MTKEPWTFNVERKVSSINGMGKNWNPTYKRKKLANYPLFLNSHLRICLLILEREEGLGRERNINMREKHWSVASCTHPDWGSNLQPFGVRDNAPDN